MGWNGTLSVRGSWASGPTSPAVASGDSGGTPLLDDGCSSVPTSSLRAGLTVSLTCLGKSEGFLTISPSTRVHSFPPVFTGRPGKSTIHIGRINTPCLKKSLCVCHPLACDICEILPHLSRRRLHGNHGISFAILRQVVSSHLLLRTRGFSSIHC